VEYYQSVKVILLLNIVKSNLMLKRMEVFKNGLFVGQLYYDTDSKESLRKRLIQVFSINVNVPCVFKVRGEIVKTFKF
jgi:hypothetical protein